MRQRLHCLLAHRQGVTLVELMVVVAILGVIAAIGSVAYGKYLKNAKIQKLNQYALEVASGQERYRSRNNFYWDGGDYVGNEDNYASLLDFDPNLPQGIEISTDAWNGDGTQCTICEDATLIPDPARAGFAVRVREDMNPGGVATTVVHTSALPSPVLLNEGE